MNAPIYSALRRGMELVGRGLQASGAEDFHATTTINGRELAVIYSKESFVELQGYVGHHFQYNGKYYGIAWIEHLHPTTVRGGFWVAQEFAQILSQEETKEFLAFALSEVVPSSIVAKPDYFLPIVRYNNRLVGLDNLTPEELEEGTDLGKLFEDLRFIENE